MNIVTDLRHYVSTGPYRETKDYKVGEKYFKNGIEQEIIRIEGDYMIIKSITGQFCVSKNYKFDKQK